MKLGIRTLTQSGCFFLLTSLVSAEALDRQAPTGANDKLDATSLDEGLIGLEVYPKAISLETAADFHRVVIVGLYEDATSRDVTASSTLAIADPSIDKI